MIGGDAGALVFPNTAMLYPLPGYDGTALTGVTLTQFFTERFAMLAGKMNVIDIYSMINPHTGGGVDGFMNINAFASAMPWFRYVNLSMWGGGLLGFSEDKQIQAGVLAFDTVNNTNTTNLDDAFEDGVGLLGFYRFFYDVKEKPGSLAFYAGTSTAEYASTERSDWHFNPGEGLTVDEKDYPVDGAVYLDQVFWEASGDKHRLARVFTGMTIADDNPSFSDFNAFLNLEATGPMTSRPKDRMGIGGWYTGLSDKFVDTLDDFGIGVRDAYGVEIYYNFEINPWLHFTADFQVVENMHEGDDTVIIPGFRLVTSF